MNIIMKSAAYLGAGQSTNAVSCLRLLLLLCVLPSLSVLLPLGPQLDAAVYEAADPTPTPEEVLLLEYLNRMRANPAKEGLLLAPPGQSLFGIPDNVDLNMFRQEMAALKPKPPMVFNLALLKAARRHSYYMIHNGQGHYEKEGLEGFSGKGPGDRAQAAGYAGGGAEDAFATGRDPAYSHLGFVIDFGPGGPGGMQKGRGHRANMMASYREVGMGIVNEGGSFSVTHDLSTRRSSARFVGGVIYVDKNGNNFYDIGEGVSGATISSEPASTATTSATSWASGAYTLELSNCDAVAITATWNGQSCYKEFPAQTRNIKFDWIIPDPAAIARIDSLLNTLADNPKNSESRSEQSRRFRALLALAAVDGRICLDKKRQVAITESIPEVLVPLEETKKLVRAAFAQELNDFKKTLRDAVKPYRRTPMQTWFDEAEMYAQAKYYVEHFDRLKDDKKAVMLKNLATAQGQVTEQEFSGLFGDLLKQAEAKM